MVRDDNTEPATDMWPLTTRDREHRRVVVEGTRTDDAQRCTLVVVHEVGGTWAWYPHGAAQLGVRLPRAEVLTLTRRILDELW